jgi:hypothetical protein
MRRGDVVALRSPAEILQTLDESGSLDGLPFMPEMLRYFGRAFRIDARVERACDTIGQSGSRRMLDTVLLDDIRCDGGGHGGCQAGCRVYWKEAWLRRVDDDTSVEFLRDDAFDRLNDLAATNSRPARALPEADLYRCQATEFVRATEPVGWWDVRSFLREVSSRNVSAWTFVRVMSRVVIDETLRRVGLRTSRPFPPSSEQTDVGPANGIVPGSKVRVRSAGEIAQTLDTDGKLRGLWFDREMIPYCGATATVKAQVRRFVDERSGAMVELKTDCFILDGVVCRGHISEGRWFCCRGIYPWWRGAWLEQEPEPEETSL